MGKGEKTLESEAEEYVEEVKNYIDTHGDRSVPAVVKKMVKDLAKRPASQQIAVSATGGWITGYLTMKVGKMAATVFGGSLILLQIASHKGYIKIDWNRMGSESRSISDRVRQNLRFQSRSGFERFCDFASENAPIAGGFTGGFFLGIASS
ncbi:FUN14 domain-containing protein 1A-like [Tigriopus californicus]|nr:FUN14 domain-containing protein 1A-like [Tigriopus californicus]